VQFVEKTATVDGFAVFKKNVQTLVDINSQYNASNQRWWAGLNQFSDVPLAKFKSTVLMTKIPKNATSAPNPPPPRSKPPPPPRPPPPHSPPSHSPPSHSPPSHSPPPRSPPPHSPPPINRKATQVATSFDWRNQGKLAPIQDQGMVSSPSVYLLG